MQVFIVARTNAATHSYLMMYLMKWGHLQMPDPLRDSIPSCIVHVRVSVSREWFALMWIHMNHQRTTILTSRQLWEHRRPCCLVRCLFSSLA